MATPPHVVLASKLGGPLFVGYSFDSADLDLARQVKSFVAALGFHVVTGEAAEPRAISQKVKKRIEEAAAALILMTPRRVGGQAGRTPAPWLVDEFHYARDRGLPTIVMVHEGIPRSELGALHADLEVVTFNPRELHTAFIKLAEMLIEVRPFARDNWIPRTISVLPSEQHVHSWITQWLDSGGVISAVDVLSAGLATRRALVASIANHGIPVRVVVAHPDFAVDHADAARLPAVIRKLFENIQPEFRDRVAIRYARSAPTVRAIVLHGFIADVPFGGFIGWYTYAARNKATLADEYPVLFVSPSGSEAGSALLAFAQKLFDTTFASAAVALQRSGHASARVRARPAIARRR